MKQAQSVAQQLPYADAFRAAAILFVFVGHLDGLQKTFTWHHLSLDTILPFDGVAMLFVLSGFLLSRPFMNAYLSARPLPLVAPYFLARFLRIYPLYFVCVVGFSLALFLHKDAIGVRDVLSHLSLTQGLSSSTVQSLSGPLWTMSVDATFYVLLPLLFAALSAIPSGNRTRSLLTLLIAGIALSAAYRFAAVLAFRPNDYNEGLVVVNQLPGMLACFLLGILGRYVVEYRPRLKSLSKMSILGGVIFVLFCRLAYLIVHQERLHVWHTASISHVAALWALEDPISALGAATLLVLIAVPEATKSVRDAMGVRLVATAAALSYAFYLLHLPILNLIGPHLPRGSAKAFFLELIVALAILVPLCSLLHCYVERPFLNVKKGLKREKVDGLPVQVEASAPAIAVAAP